MLFGKLHQNCNFIRINRTSFYLPGQCVHWFEVNIVQGINNWQRQLTFSHIITSGFAYLLRIEIIEDIITNLEHNTQVLTKLFSFQHLFLRSTTRHSTNSGTSLKQSRRLLLDNIVIHIFRDSLILNVWQLQNLTSSQRTAQFSEIFNNTLMTSERHMKQSGRKDVIAYQDCHLIIIGSINGRLTSTLVTFVYHIVMNEWSRMQQFKTNGRMLSDVTNITKIACHQHHQNGAHTFSSTLTNMSQSRT